MSILGVIIVLVLIAVILAVLPRILPLDGKIWLVTQVVVVIFVILWLASVFHLFSLGPKI